MRDPYEPWRETLLSVERVRELSRLRPTRVVADTAACWFWILAAWTAVCLWPRPWVIALAVPVIGNRYYALFILGHDGMHRRLFPSLKANDLFCDLLLLGPIGAITRINNGNHLAHHRHLATELDPDRYKHACFNKTTRVEYLAFLSGLTSVWRAVRAVFVEAGRGVSAERRYNFRDLVILAGWQGLLIGGLSAAIGPWAWPLLWLLPVYLFSYLADLLRSFVEHSHPQADAQADARRLISFVSHPLERLVFAPMSMNLHAAHHLWTSIPYYNLARADREMQTHPQSAGLEWRGTYLGYLLRYFVALPLPGCRRNAAVAASAR